MDRKFLVGAIAAWAALTAACHAADALMLQTEEGGNVRFSAFDAKFQPMQRRADDSFKRYVAKVEVESGDASCGNYAIIPSTCPNVHRKELP